MHPYLCSRCLKDFAAVPLVLSHLRRPGLCHGHKVILRSEYNRQLKLAKEALAESNVVDNQFAAPSGLSNGAHTNSTNLTAAKQRTPVSGSAASIPPPSLIPTPPPVTNPDPLLGAYPTEFGFEFESSFSTENEPGTYQPHWVPNTYPLSSIPPPTASNPSFPLVFPLPISNSHSSCFFDNGLGSATLDELHRNPWIGGLDGTCNEAEGGVGRNDTEAVCVGQPEPPAQTELNGVASEVQIDPGITEENIQSFLQPEKAYIRRVSKGRVIYQHPTAGRTYGRGQTRWEAEREKNKRCRNGNPYGMWASKDEWETVKWMATEKLSQASINKLLKTERYKDAKYSFKNAKTLFNKIRDEMGAFGGPEWHVDDVALADAPKDKSTLFFKDIQKCADHLMGQARFAGKMAFSPEKHYDADSMDQLFENPWTADDWGEQQESLPEGTTSGGLYFASDSTILSTHSGDVAVHAVYMTLANIDGSVRASTSEDAWVLVAYIPKSKFEKAMSAFRHRPKAVRTKILGMLNRRLFHRCMTIITRPLRRQNPHDVVDPEGYIRSVQYELAGYIADLEEQWLVAGLGGQTCPHCTRDSTHLGDHESGLPRTRDEFLEQLDNIKEVHEDTWGRPPSLEEYMDLAGEKHFNGVDKPFWRFVPGLDIFRILSPDLLHGFHKFFHDHSYRFNRTGMGIDEYDARIRLQSHFSGDRSFLHGVSHISQMTGIEHRVLERTHLPIVANAPGVINEKVTRATRGIMECIYLAQLPVQSDRTLQAYEAAYEDFMANRQAWIDNGTRRGKKQVIPHFNIPKMHVIRHHTYHVRRKGCANNFTTETMEHLHVGLKEAYRASNRREWKMQTVRWLNRRDMMRDFEAWMAWCRAEEEKSCQGQELANEPTRCLDNETQGGSDDSSVEDKSVEEEGDGSDESEIEEEEEGGDEEFEDPDCYGEQLVDECDAEGEEDDAGKNKVQRWLMRQTGSVVGGGSGSRKRKRRSDRDDKSNPRSQPRPRLALQVTHGISDLQKVRLKANVRRTPIHEVCRDHSLDPGELIEQVNRCPQTATLPVSIDEYTHIDVWHALRTNLHSTAHKTAGMKMQRIRCKPAARDRKAKHDPVFFIMAEGKTARTAKLHGSPDLPTNPHPPSPQPPANGVPTVPQQDPPLSLQKNEPIERPQTRQAQTTPACFSDGHYVDRDDVFDEFSSFYLNKYRNIDDYIFMFSGSL
ncbi:hypothetical protein FRC09_012715 [Ceratobasidium sp. 395]|nr:hypothetical protein FRC09_012715 [Ceratobasidium sp. 395]